MCNRNDSFKKFHDFSRTYFLEQFKLSDKLYHYTNEIGLLKIITSKMLRVKNINYFSDRKEYDYGIQLAIKVLKGNYKQDTAFRSFLYDQILKFYNHRDSYFILSMSNSHNNNYLWTNYAGKDGACLGFDKYDFENDKMCLSNIMLYPTTDRNLEIEQGMVIYDEGKQVEIIKKILNELKFVWNKNEGYVTPGFCLGDLSKFLLMFKRKIFMYEQEYRFIFYFYNEKQNALQEETKCIDIPFQNLRQVYLNSENSSTTNFENKRKELQQRLCNVGFENVFVE
jgi:hypothetical protein